MLDDKNKLRNLISTISALFDAEKDFELVELLKTAEINSELAHYDNWNGGTAYYSIYLSVSVEYFVKFQNIQNEIETKIKDKFELILRSQENTHIGNVFIVPKSVLKIEWNNVADLVTKDQLLVELDKLKNIMISVSTGGQRIQDVNEDYEKRYSLIDKVLKRLSLQNPNLFSDLWQWYAKWSSGELPQYRDRRLYIKEMYNSLLKTLEETEEPQLLEVSVDLTGWDRIDRAVKEIKVRLQQSTNEEQFQTVGLLCRETIISIGQAIFDKEKHPILDGVNVSKTDAKRMLDAYITVELAGGANESLRKYARASNDLANELTHKRTANKRDAALCSSATISLVNLIGILEDRH